jgi:hypothetical protein
MAVIPEPQQPFQQHQLIHIMETSSSTPVSLPASMSYQQQGQFAGYQQQGLRRNQPMNPVKRHKNWNYCWSHGHDVE